MRSPTDLRDRSERRLHERARAIHDLRGPLTVIRGQCFSLNREERRPERRRRLALIESEVERLGRVLDGLLGVGPAEDIPAPGEPAVVLTALVAAVAERHQGAAARAGVRLLTRLRTHSLIVPGDPELVLAALDNLVQNALRHTPRGGTIRVSLVRRRAGAHVRVRDDGPGVPEGDRQRIFAAGERGGAPRGAGAGLGLAIARQIAEAHGGTLELEPFGPGASFRLTLPLGPAGAGDARSPERAA